MDKITGYIERQWARLDPKLKYTVLTGAATYVATKYLAGWSDGTQAILTAVIASVTGYRVSNDGSILRKGPDSGNVPQVDDPDRADTDPAYVTGDDGVVR